MRFKMTPIMIGIDDWASCLEGHCGSVLEPGLGQGLAGKRPCGWALAGGIQLGSPRKGDWSPSSSEPTILRTSKRDPVVCRSGGIPKPVAEACYWDWLGRNLSLYRKL